MFGKKTDGGNTITVSKKVHTRAKEALALGTPNIWVDQCLFLVGQNVTHHKRGDHLLDEAIQGAEALLAILVEMKNAEEAL